MMLTGKQRYWQAVRKARIIRDRSMRRMIQGLDAFAIGGNDRNCLIDELDRAYSSGARDATASERERCVSVLRQRARDHRISRELYDDEISQISCLRDALEAHGCADAISREPKS